MKIWPAGLKKQAEYSYQEYPLAMETVDGRKIRRGVDNTSSIGASLNDYFPLPGIREVPMSDFAITGKHYSVEGNDKISQLMAQIKESGEISPLIVAIDGEGPYILEGSTRIDALYNLGAKSFPALVVIDLGNKPAGFIEGS